jgi:hypothetical protein
VERRFGAVKIENNTDWNFKDLEEILRNAKVLIRNTGECKGILIGPSMAPHFPGCRDSVVVFFLAA